MGKMIKTIGLYVNGSRDAGFKVTGEILDIFTECGRRDDIRLCGGADVLFESFPGIPKAELCETDCVVTLGGDGTLLRAAREAALSGTPIMGINLGRLGYLTDVGAEGAKNALCRLLAGEYKLECRIMLESENDGPAGLPRLALNDMFVGRSGPPKLLTFKVDINGEHMDTYQADGILVSTPTGSTAYGLSAGGPVIKPDADILAITPVCPHALHVRSAVVSADDVVSITILSGAEGGALYMDGEYAALMAQGQEKVIRRSKYRTYIVKTKEKGFYDILREKMKWE